MIDNIDKLSKNYMRQGLYLTVALSLLTLLVMRVWFLDLLTAVLVSAAFTLVVCGAIGLIWRYVAKHSPDSLPTFFYSSFRLPPVVGISCHVCLLFG